ncbi:IS3 family transposase [Spiroplasma platyhelix]|uniref:IS3 family transposase n=1 Tax=Spiroplasma platyhelix TaxID=301585 RepID=UPI0022855999|nr:IS3 family transposase [Spiroplasma platyhelix]
MQRNFKANKSNEKRVTAITYIRIPYEQKYLYLSTIIDLYNREIIAYKISEENNIKLVIETLKSALLLTNKEKLNGLILHSNQGFQYTSIQYKNVCKSYGLNPSYSRKGTPLDNAVIESFHSILKKETIYNKFIKTKHDMINLIHEWINFYQSYRVRL